MAERMLRRGASHPMEFAVDGDVTLYPPGTDQAIVLNGTASSIWRRLAEPTSMPDLISELAREYEQSAADIAEDVAAVIDVLEAQGVIVSSPLVAPPD